MVFNVPACNIDQSNSSESEEDHLATRVVLLQLLVVKYPLFRDRNLVQCRLNDTARKQ